MKYFMLGFFLLFLSSNLSLAQSNQDTITYQKIFGGYKLSQSYVPLNMTTIKGVLQQNKEAYFEYRSANTWGTLAQVFASAGGALIGWNIGQAISGKNQGWGLVSIGLGCVAASVPMVLVYNKKMIKAVKIYNNGLKTSSLYDDYEAEIELAYTGNGVGLLIKF